MVVADPVLGSSHLGDLGQLVGQDHEKVAQVLAVINDAEAGEYLWIGKDGNAGVEGGGQGRGDGLLGGGLDDGFVVDGSHAGVSATDKGCYR